jgi:hypothetical protein
MIFNVHEFNHSSALVKTGIFLLFKIFDLVSLSQ